MDAASAYVTGYVDESSFPVKVGHVSRPALVRAFVVKVRTGQIKHAGYIAGASELGLRHRRRPFRERHVTGRWHKYAIRVGPVVIPGPLAKVKADGSGFDYAGYIAGVDAGTGVADAAGSVCSRRQSPQATFPIKVVRD